MKLRNVNTTDIAAAIEAGTRTMASVFNADDDDIPFFGSVVWPDPRLAFSSVHSEAHVPGRHLNALLTAESLGFPIDEAAVNKHARAAFFSYGGPLPLPLNRERMDGPLVNLRPHNVREGFHALYALAQFRDSAQAHDVAEASIAAINELWDPDRDWDYEGAARDHGIDVKVETTFIRGVGRAIGPLVKYYRATGYGPALELAIRLKDKAVTDHFTPDGSYSTERFGPHTHSTTCVMSSLAQLADLLNDAPLMERVRTFYSRPVEEGAVGAGTGTSAFGWKGGIGTSSRVLPASLGGYTVGVLVQSNFGGILQILGAPVGRELGRYAFSAQVGGNGDGDSPDPGREESEDQSQGSIMMVVATDAPLSERNLERVARRAVMGLARTGSFAGNGSGDYVISFSTAAGVRRRPGDGVRTVEDLSNGDMSALFQATVEATEEAIYNSLFRATTVSSRWGTREALPIEDVVEVLERHGVIRR